MTGGGGKQLSIELILGDCLEKMAGIPDGSVDAIICDLPYGGMTACKWDVLIPFEPLWAHYKRVIKPNGAVVLFGSEPFSSHLRLSNLPWYRYDWKWHKTCSANFLMAKRRPLQRHEDICVFYGAEPTYNPQMEAGGTYTRAGHAGKDFRSEIYNGGKYNRADIRDRSLRYPGTVIRFGNGNQKRFHPTQKPSALCEYLIRTYTNPGETVLDNTMGSASCAVACLNTGRNFIGIEKDASYYEIARRRIADAQAQLTFTDGSGDESV